MIVGFRQGHLVFKIPELSVFFNEPREVGRDKRVGVVIVGIEIIPCGACFLTGRRFDFLVAVEKDTVFVVLVADRTLALADDADKTE